VYPSGIGSSNVVPSRGIVDIVFRHIAALYRRKVDAAVVADVLDARMLAILFGRRLCTSLFSLFPLLLFVVGFG